MKLKKYMHLYLPFEVIVPDENGICIAVAINDQSIFIDSGCDYTFDAIKPVLRTIDDLTDEEKEILYHDTRTGRIKFDIGTMFYQVGINHDATIYLLKWGIDLFGIITDGLAIRKNEIRL